MTGYNFNFSINKFMKNNYLVFLLMLIGVACNQGSETNQTGFVTLLGNDTLAVEQFEKTANGIKAQVVLRSPETSFASYDLKIDDAGGIREMVRRDYSLEEQFSGRGEAVQTIRKENDSLIVERQTEEGIRTDTVEYQKGTLPFFDMVHWPYELALNNAAGAPQETIEQQFLTGDRLSTFIIAKIKDDSVTIRHPFRGVMGVDINNTGDLLYLDAGLTTRKLKVHRTSNINIDEIGNRFAEREQNGNIFGELSGAESEEFSFNDATFRVEYGTPEKRGRTIFGGIVPWGERWRTGANRATHFRTSHDLVIGDLKVPAGEYTLFTIPEKDGGTLIINEQTDQNGQSYDESRDLGRVPMERSTQTEVTEKFTITVEENGNNSGLLKLIWDQTVFTIDFEIE